MEEYIISIIVPVYRVEKYLKRCIESLIAQSFDSYEIVLVDDGSDDNCPLICDEYSLHYSFIKTYHKTNGGLSDARNYGLTKATGQYVTFVDSDDYVSSDYLSCLYNGVKNECEIACCGVSNEYENGNVFSTLGVQENCVFNRDEAFTEMCYGSKLPIFAWGKLYKKNIVSDILFPLGRLHEDIATTYRIIDKTEKVYISNSKAYHYILRQGSILHTTFNNKMKDSIFFANNIVEYAKTNYSVNSVQYKASCARLAFEANALLHRSVLTDEYNNIRLYCLENLANKWGIIFSDRRISIKIKIQLALCKLSRSIYKSSYSIFKRTSVRK